MALIEGKNGFNYFDVKSNVMSNANNEKVREKMKGFVVS